MTDGISIKAAECQFCWDTGWVSYEQPMTGLDGNVTMVRVPSPCWCKAGNNFRNQQFTLKGDVIE